MSLFGARPIVFGDSVVGTVKVGSHFNEASAEELKRRTGLEVVFVSHAKVTASTFGKDNVGSVETGSASTQVLEAARSLSTESSRLKTAVESFLLTVRAA